MLCGLALEQERDRKEHASDRRVARQVVSVPKNAWFPAKLWKQRGEASWEDCVELYPGKPDRKKRLGARDVNYGEG